MHYALELDMLKGAGVENTQEVLVNVQFTS
jgi:hypothetical protein